MGLMTMENVVADVQSRVIKEGKPDQRLIYDVIDREGVKWTAWEKDLAERAWNLKGQSAVWKVESVQNGQYTNRSLKDIQPAMTGGMGQALTSPDPFKQSEPFGNASNSMQMSDGGLEAKQWDSEKNKSIHRQCAAKVAAALMPSTQTEFWENVQMLVGYFNTGIVPGGEQQQAHSEEPPPNDDIPF